jgi:hypothetical protein
MMSPHLADVLWFAAGEMYKYPTRCSEVRRSPLLVALAKSSLVVSRAFFGSTLLLRDLLAFTLKDVSDP